MAADDFKRNSKFRDYWPFSKKKLACEQKLALVVSWNCFGFVIKMFSTKLALVKSLEYVKYCFVFLQGFIENSENGQKMVKIAILAT